MEQKERNKIIVRTGAIGIAANVLLAGFKAFIGLLANSVAVILDAVNNLSDALSSVITIIGTKLAAKKPDKKHPLGHGRIEYLTAMIIAIIVLFAGITSMIESVKKIIEPAVTNYTVLSVIVIAVAVIVKLILGRYTQKKGKQTNSNALIASGKDAFFDAVISMTTIIGAATSMIWGLNIDGWLGVLISAVIIKAGFDILRETLSDILGRRVDAKTAAAIKSDILEFEGVLGVYDLLVDQFGPNSMVGSVHIEVPDTMSADQIDRLTGAISSAIATNYHMYVTCGIYSVDVTDPLKVEMRKAIIDKLMAKDGILEIHALRIDNEKKRIRFDLVYDFDVKDVEALLTEAREAVNELYPQHVVMILPDIDLSVSEI